jgi:hypothetical protein
LLVFRRLVNVTNISAQRPARDPNKVRGTDQRKLANPMNCKANPTACPYSQRTLKPWREHLMTRALNVIGGATAVAAGLYGGYATAGAALGWSPSPDPAAPVFDEVLALG